MANPSLLPTAGVSASGTLAFQTGGDVTTQAFSWFNRSGIRTGTLSLGSEPILPRSRRTAVLSRSKAPRLVISMCGSLISLAE